MLLHSQETQRRIESEPDHTAAPGKSLGEKSICEPQIQLLLGLQLWKRTLSAVTAQLLSAVLGDWGDQREGASGGRCAGYLQIEWRERRRPRIWTALLESSSQRYGSAEAVSIRETHDQAQILEPKGESIVQNPLP